MKLYEVHETKSSIYLVMELLEGGNLKEFISKNGPLNPETTKRFMKSILTALSYLEDKKVLHRDIKPENLIIRSDSAISELVLVDFGLSTKWNCKDYFFKRCGTPGFIPPEILQGEASDVGRLTLKCDVFSAGLTFYEM